MKAEKFITLKIGSGLLHEYDDGKFKTLVFGFIPKTIVNLPEEHTFLGILISGTMYIKSKNVERKIVAGDFFSIIGPAKVYSNGSGIASSVYGYRGINMLGGPIEQEGRLRYINGCTDTLLVPPLRKGDPCLNHLHFPTNTIQTPHTHPSVRINIVYRGSGVCLVPEEDREVPLVPGYVFVITTETIHSFNTMDKSMDVITFHPDSDVGMTDDNHPMVNRTIVDGISANQIDEIRTKKA